mmetsp:Transcript_28950/g.50919  ORF Transcript_28950/g.50919 Transcript_28950/m.50919 type:complete len:411 (-) Transcript_28950:287-1519(-)|eukprot:CAMPEP_0197533004 /NCGR_PEP_ID=MMETSP1318-20131121/41826_1 /TAXON_ID=552666 /ORGANISM="Partenskyella glossopodia, Strain RCC365" /LENGTH=410 /DNA_ID=CAMNT_0043089741 /DNA_START=104 /DNA_END=1336 /DNA_ORIENTATION=+
MQTFLRRTLRLNRMARFPGRRLSAAQSQAQQKVEAADASTGDQQQNQNTEKKIKTAVVMLNMGGPSAPGETKAFLTRLFLDNDIIELGGGTFQRLLGNFIAKRRTPKVQKQYEEIGGSPIRKWTEYQGEQLAKRLDLERPTSAPHKAYTCFRYAHPLTEEALTQMKADGVEHAIAFSQFPQWSCTTTGSSMNELWRNLKAMGMEDDFKWSLIDRWALQPKFLDAVVDRITERFNEFDDQDKSKVVILFSAHSVPMKVVEKGDVYVNEVSATCKAIMDKWEKQLGHRNKHVVAWQSKVGFLPWMVPSTEDTIKAIGKRGNKHVLVVPIAFTTDHIETLYEIGMEYAEEAEEAGISNFKYTEGLNGSPLFIDALADIVTKHLDEGKNHSAQYKQKCLTCQKPMCRQLINPAF